jgi:phytoene dehydrogenase-like protein
MAPIPPIRTGLKVAARLPRVGGLAYVRSLLTPAAMQWGEFGGDSARLLLAGNACHADIPVDAPGSGLIGLLLTMLGQTLGFPAPTGGAGQLATALRRRLESRGGMVVCQAPVSKVVVRGGRAVAVEALGQQVWVRRAVLADVGAEQLYGGLVDAAELPTRVARRMKEFRRDPATFKIDYALRGPVPWAVPPPYPPGTVHIADSYADIITYFGQIAAGTIPARPFLLIGQMTTTDPTRSPDGTESLWVYTHIPQQVRNDAGGVLTGSWDTSEAEHFADRMQGMIEKHAPGFESSVIARRILTPADLESRNANLVGGSLNGGTSSLDQQLIFRPIPGLGRAETAIKDLYLASASAHPGGSVHGACGMNAARAAIAHARFRRH